ncbi:MAG: MFS transporter [Acidobacteria bacterium]|nr:MFS transporter [Acidobacteriota bacterium]
MSNPNFRRYAGAQFLHGAGMWAHHLAEVWLVYAITDSAFVVGLTVAVRSGSSVVLAPVAGTLADRMDRRRLLAATQASKAVVASGLALLALGMQEDLPLAVLFAAVAVLGVIGAIDTPLRRAFVRDVVLADGVDRAARLHTSVMSVGRFLGSGAAWLFLSLSAAWACFAVNGATSLLAATLVLRVVPTTVTTSRDARAAGGRVLGYLLRTPAVTIPMALLCSFTLFGWNLAVLLPVIADKQLASGAGTFAILAQVMAVGSLIGSVMMAASKLAGPRNLAILLAVFSATMVSLSAVNHLVAGIAAMRRVLEPVQRIGAVSGRPPPSGSGVGGLRGRLRGSPRRGRSDPGMAGGRLRQPDRPGRGGDLHRSLRRARPPRRRPSPSERLQRTQQHLTPS